MFKNLINGEWVQAPRASRNINPSDTRDIIGEYGQADAAQTRDAAGSEILARRAELGDLLAREEGKVDDARKAGTDIGPVVDERQLAQNLEYVDIARNEGAQLAWGGQAIERNADGQPGFFMAPALFTGTSSAIRRPAW